MTVLSQFLDSDTLAKLSEGQIRTLNDQLEGGLVKLLYTNDAAKAEIGKSLQSAAASHLKVGK